MPVKCKDFHCLRRLRRLSLGVALMGLAAAAAQAQAQSLTSATLAVINAYNQAAGQLLTAVQNADSSAASQLLPVLTVDLDTSIGEVFQLVELRLEAAYWKTPAPPNMETARMAVTEADFSRSEIWRVLTIWLEWQYEKDRLIAMEQLAGAISANIDVTTATLPVLRQFEGITLPATLLLDLTPPQNARPGEVVHMQATLANGGDTTATRVRLAINQLSDRAPEGYEVLLGDLGSGQELVHDLYYAIPKNVLQPTVTMEVDVRADNSRPVTANRSIDILYGGP